MSASNTYTLKCGCVSLVDRERMVTMCAPHAAEFKETHERWTRDYRESHPTESTT